jgi:hypothetical protein
VAQAAAEKAAVAEALEFDRMKGKGGRGQGRAADDDE